MKGFDLKDISKLSQRMATTYRLLIAIKHTLRNWPLVDYRKKQTKCTFANFQKWADGEDQRFQLLLCTLTLIRRLTITGANVHKKQGRFFNPAFGLW